MNGAVGEIELSGRTLRVGRLRVGHLLEIERKLIGERRDPLEAIVVRWNSVTDSQRRELLEAAFEHLSRPPAVGLAEIVAWLNAPLGTTFAFWLVAREQQPELTWEECRELVMRASPATLERIQRALAPELWEDELGNSLGQVQHDGAASRGPACFAS
jgi:hypothetical protein